MFTSEVQRLTNKRNKQHMKTNRNLCPLLGKVCCFGSTKQAQLINTKCWSWHFSILCVNQRLGLCQMISLTDQCLVRWAIVYLATDLMKEARILFRGLFWDQIFGLGLKLRGFKIRPHWSFWGKIDPISKILVLFGAESRTLYDNRGR